jgi:hypothetical protein
MCRLWQSHHIDESGSPRKASAGLQKVSAQFEVNKAAPQTVLNNE